MRATSYYCPPRSVNALVAQLVEQKTLNLLVVGSNPPERTRRRPQWVPTFQNPVDSAFFIEDTSSNCVYSCQQRRSSATV